MRKFLVLFKHDFDFYCPIGINTDNQPHFYLFFDKYFVKEGDGYYYVDLPVIGCELKHDRIYNISYVVFGRRNLFYFAPDPVCGGYSFAVADGGEYTEYFNIFPKTKKIGRARGIIVLTKSDKIKVIWERLDKLNRSATGYETVLDSFGNATTQVYAHTENIPVKEFDYLI